MSSKTIYFVMMLASALAFGCGDDDGGTDSGADAAMDSSNDTLEDTTPDSAGDTAPDTDGDLCEDVDCSSLDEACVVGVCDPATGACGTEARPEGTTCDDGIACTEMDGCMAGVCEGTPIVCGEPATCRAMECNEDTGSCESVRLPDGTPCDDGSSCTSNDVCGSSGVCAGEYSCERPIAVVLSGDIEPLTEDGEEPSGSSLDCPEGMVLTGLFAHVIAGPDLDSGMGQTKGICRPLILQGDSSDGYRVATGTPEDTGVSAGSVRAGSPLNCPDDQIVVGFFGAKARAISSIGLVCAPLIVREAEGALELALGETSNVGPIISSTGASEFSASPCPSGVGVSLVIDTDQWRPSGSPSIRYVSDLAIECQGVALGIGAEFGPITSSPFAGNEAVGELNEDDCPSGTTIVGLQFAGSGPLRGVGAVCRDIAVTDRTDPEGFVWGRVGFTSRRGSSTLDNVPECPRGSALVGFSGRSARLIDGVSLECKRVAIVDGALSTVGDVMSVDYVGGSGGMPFESVGCEEGLALGINSYTTPNELAALSLRCAVGLGL